MGAAGDMLCAALYDLLDDGMRNAYIDEMNASGLPGVKVVAKADSKCGIAGTHMHVTIDGVEEAEHHHDHEYHDHEHDHHDHDHHHDHHDHNHDHHDHHHHTHHHASMQDVEQIIDSTTFSDKVKKDAKKVYEIIAAAESKAHGKPVAEVHFHEVGMMDAIADVLGACRLIEMLGVQNVYSSPVRVGFGEVHCAHGIMPVPAPATAYILQGVPTYAGDIRGEMCTPTGAALLTYFAKFIDNPELVTQKIGYGTGHKDFERANVVRAYLGNVCTDKHDSGNKDAIVELACNIDDMTGEAIGCAIDIIREAGALDVYTTSAMMKKDRPGVVLTILCKPEDEQKIVSMVFKHTSSWGLRRRDVERYIMDRDFKTVKTEYGDISIKEGSGFGVKKYKPEYEDVVKAASKYGVSFEEVIKRCVIE